MVTRLSTLITAVLLVLGTEVWAGPNAGAAILGEAGVIVKTIDCTMLSTEWCDELVPVIPSPGTRNYVAVYVGRAQTQDPLSIMQVDFGIEYTPAYEVTLLGYEWNGCGVPYFVYPTETWPASGSGISVVWTTPQTGFVVLVGWLEVNVLTGYGPALFYLGDHPQRPAQVLDGNLNVDLLIGPSAVSHNGAPGWNQGCNPGDPVQVKPVTWSRIKAQYGP